MADVTLTQAQPTAPIDNITQMCMEMCAAMGVARGVDTTAQVPALLVGANHTAAVQNATAAASAAQSTTSQTAPIQDTASQVAAAPHGAQTSEAPATEDQVPSVAAPLQAQTTPPATTPDLARSRPARSPASQATTPPIQSGSAQSGDIVITAAELARAYEHARTIIARLVGDDVAVYKVLNDFIQHYVERESSRVLSEAYLQTTSTVRGLVLRAKAITAPYLATLNVPMGMIDAMAASMDFMRKVAKVYHDEYERTNDPILDADNKRHRYFRARFMEMYHILVQRGRVVELNGR